MLTEWLRVAGRFHPLVLHLPIGLIAGAALLEIVSVVRRAPVSRAASSVLVCFAALAAAVTAGSGYLLQGEGGYDDDTVYTHRWLGFTVAGCALVLASLHTVMSRSRSGRPAARMVWGYRAWLLVTLGFLVPAGHFGSTLTRGDGYLTAPLRDRTPPAPLIPPTGDPPAVVESSYRLVIAPIFESRCAKCHNPTKKKGKLVLIEQAGILAGGKSGPVIVPGKPEQSELVRRLRLGMTEEDHMPPEGKAQPTDDEIRALEQWIAAGAPFEGMVAGLTASAAAPPAAPLPPATTAAAPPPVPPAPKAALDRLREALVHVEPISQGSSLLWIDFAAAAKKTSDADVAALLEPVREQVAELSLAGCTITDAAMPLIARMPNLRRLDLRSTPITDVGVAPLAGHPHLEELVLAQTKLSDAAAESLLALPALRTLYLWHAGLSEEAIGRLRTERPSLRVNAGEVADAAALEAEQDLKFSSNAPLPGAAPAAPAASAPGASALVPVNATCPVTGNPLNPKYQIVYKGRVIGFCCPNCPGEFWADPAKFEAKLPPPPP